MADGLHADAERDRVLLGLLELVERDGAQSQRRLAAELGVALGLVNAYLKRCAKKGLIKIKQAPTRRYAYYLTPHGFAEKSRLTVEYLSLSFGFFRQAKTDCSELFRTAKLRGVRNVLLIGHSDLAEIAALCAMQHGVVIAGLVDETTEDAFIGAPVFKTLDDVDAAFDAVLVTDVRNARATSEATIARLGVERVLVPEILRVRIRQEDGAVQ